MTDWLIAGAFLALPYTIYALFQTLRGHSRPNLFGMVLAVLAVLVVPDAVELALEVRP